MDFFPQILSADDAYAEIVNAYSPRSGQVFAAVQFSSENLEATASALFELDLREGISWKLLHEFDSGMLAYLLENEATHYLLASGGYLHMIKNELLQVYGYVSEEFLDGLAPLAPGRISIFGERGEFYLFENGKFQKVELGTDETLFCADFTSPTSGCVAGNYGTLLKWDGGALHAQDIGSHAFIRAVKFKRNGAVLLACTDGEAFELRDDQVTELAGGNADFYSVEEFNGHEYWGDDGFGILQREGDDLVDRFNTEYAFQINTSDEYMTVNAGYWIFLFDGANWTKIQLNENLDTLFEIVPAGF